MAAPKSQTCLLCHQPRRGRGSYCPACREVARSLRYARGNATSLPPEMDPERENRIKRYTERETAKLPLFG